MDSGQLSSLDGSATTETEALRGLMVTATQRLLGDTIAVPDEQWRAPSRLQGWTRAHVATHLARQADALTRLVEGARAGRHEPMYSSPDQREREIEEGAGRTGLELQIDLDTSAGALAEAFESVEHEDAWNVSVELRGGLQAPVRFLPLARLGEVVLHHVDLDVGFGVDDIDQSTAGWLLEWSAFRLQARDDFPAVRLVPESGGPLLVGNAQQPGPATEVRGTSAELLGWLTGRSPGSRLDGATGVQLPAF
jgi:maleylpyruvate isomerase